MTIQQLKNAHQKRPFVPFSIRTANGRDYPVPHPEFMMITPPGRTVVVTDNEGTVDTIDLLLVASLSFGNGKPKARSTRRRK